MSLTLTNTVTDLYTAGVGQDAFSFANIKIFQSSDLEVYVDGVLQSSSLYTIPAGDIGPLSNGGTFTFITPMAGGEKVIARRKPPLTQGTLYPETGTFPSSSHETALDKLTQQTQYNSIRHNSLISYVNRFSGL